MIYGEKNEKHEVHESIEKQMKVKTLVGAFHHADKCINHLKEKARHHGHL